MAGTRLLLGHIDRPCCGAKAGWRKNERMFAMDNVAVQEATRMLYRAINFYFKCQIFDPKMHWKKLHALPFTAEAVVEPAGAPSSETRLF